MDTLELSNLEFLDNGCWRNVFLTPKGTVVKETISDSLFCDENETERKVWNAVKGTKFEQYFLPLLGSSSCGQFNEFPFAEDVLQEDIYGILVPCFWRDQQVCNFGLYKGRVVIRDYGHRSLEDCLEKILLDCYWEEV